LVVLSRHDRFDFFIESSNVLVNQKLLFMKKIFVGKILAFSFTMVITFLTIKYISVNWNLTPDWYKATITLSSFIIICGLFALAVGGKEITKVMLVTLPGIILIFDAVKAVSLKEGLDDSYLLWFKYKETMSYGIRLLWHLGLDYFVFIVVLILKNSYKFFQRQEGV
jgi:hypothetical protein